jgi:hypothetical protein
MRKVKRTERGWAGHFICADRCRFRRNTLLECGDRRVVVSTVGLFYPNHNTREPEQIGYERHFETMAFVATFDGRYWDADVQQQINFRSPWSIGLPDMDDTANDMHEAVVDELTALVASDAPLIRPDDDDA